MIYYANPTGSEVVRDAQIAGLLGCITTPAQGNVIFPTEVDTIADNGCFSDVWTERKWLSWLDGLPRSVRFAVCPDVFDPSGSACHGRTMARWATFAPAIRSRGFTPAFVCQVGATSDDLPADAEVLFLGGTTEWKLGPEAHRITATAKADGRWVHMGRVNSERRIVTALEMGCDSVDGTYVTFAPEKNLPRLLRFLDRAHESVDTQPAFDLYGTAS